MSDSYYTTKDLIEKIGISESTLKNWVRQFNLKPISGPGNTNRYDDQLVKIFQAIKNLRDDSKGFDTIQSIIGGDCLTDNSQVTQSYPSATTSETDNDGNLITAVVKAIQDNNELAEKYARATYTIGQLEAEKKFLELKVQELNDKIQLLPDPIEHNQIRQENEQIKKELELIKRPLWKKILSLFTNR